MKILVTYRAIHNTAGGVERISSWLMNELVKHGHQVEFVTLDSANAVSFYPLESSVIWHKLGIGDPSQNACFSTRIKRILAIRDIIKEFKPELAIGFQEASYLSTRLAAIGLCIPVIAAERNSPSRFKFMPSGKSGLAFLSFFFARFITVQSESFRKHYPSWLREKIRVIPNPVIPVKISENKKENIILSVGRLEYQKNFSCLIKAFAKISGHFPDWTLSIIGEGNNRAELESLISTYKLENRIKLPGSDNELAKYYETAKIFCLPSRWEGFPNALAEALAHGLPATGFESCDGVSDLIIHENNGLLAAGNDNADSLAEALLRMIGDEKLRDEMAKNAIASIQSYEPSAIFAQWERLFRDAVSE